MGDEIYCVYVKLGPDGTPAYVGAGTKNRPGYHDRRNVRHRNKRLAAIYKEAGVKNLPTQIILENLTQSAAARVERQLIARIGRINRGTGPLCNKSEGGEVMSVAHRAKIGAATLVRCKDPEYCAKLSKAIKTNWSDHHARRFDAETRTRWIAAIKARMSNPEARAKMSEMSKARWADPDYRAKMASPEVRGRQSEAQKAQWVDPDYRARQSERSKARWADPEMRVKMSEAIKASWADPEMRAKMSEAIKAGWRRRNAARLGKTTDC